MSAKPAPTPGERLAKVIARAGVCSRRDAESFILAGRVSVNGSPVKTPAFNVVESDKVAVDGKPIARRAATQLWLYHKPAGLMVTEKDPEGRPTVFEAIERLGLPRVLTVGRLDYNTEGLLLLTNDGGLKRTLELPATGWVRRYRVRAFGSVTQDQLNALANGITVEGVEYGAIEATLDTVTGSNVWITLGLREGKNREVRNVLGALGLEVNRLIRLSYGPFQLGDLPVGAVEKVKSRVLQDQLGKRLASEAGADFDSPVNEEEGQPRRRSPERPESRPTERDRFGGLRKRPDFSRPERREAAPRVVHFDDGRPSETFVPRGDGKPRDRGDKPERGDGFKKRFDDGPRTEGKRSFGDRPPRRDGDKPFAKGPRRDGDKPGDRPEGKRSFGDRPPRRDGDKPFSKGPRSFGGKPGDRPSRDGAERPFREGSARPEGKRSFGDRPPRRDGDKPFAKGPRRDGGKPAGRASRDGAERPFREGSARPEGKRSFGDRPPRRDGDKPFGKGPRRDDARPSAGGLASKPRDGRAFEGPSPGKPGGGKSFGKPSGGKGFGAPRGGKPAGRPSGDRSRGGKPSGAPRGRKGE